METIAIPDFLTHYYEHACGPFRNLSDLEPSTAENILNAIRAAGAGFASKRSDDYLRIRRDLEDQVRQLFIEKGGRPQRQRPHYMILGACPWVKSWYSSGQEVCIPLAEFPSEGVSFTYGDTFPAMRMQDGKPYRRQVYVMRELPDLIAAYGLPQEWNADGSLAPERYIEAQVWDDAPLKAYL